MVKKKKEKTRREWRRFLIDLFFHYFSSNKVEINMVGFLIYNYLRADVRDWKTTSSQGIVRPMSWSNPNSSSALCKRLWNCGVVKNEIGTMYLLLFSPTYTTKWPFGTSTGSPSSSYHCFFPRLEHLFRICLIIAVCENLFDLFLIAILLFPISWSPFPFFCVCLRERESNWNLEVVWGIGRGRRVYI